MDEASSAFLNYLNISIIKEGIKLSENSYDNFD
jgi:hypothetical protein